MRLLLPTVDFPPEPGGVQSLYGCLVGGLARRGHDVTVVAPGAAGARDWDAGRPFRVVRVRPTRSVKATLPALLARALGAALARRPDAVVCGHVLLGPAWRAGRALAPYVTMVHGFEIRAPRMRRIATVALHGSARVVANSGFTAAAVRALGVPAGRVVVLHPGPAVEGRPGALDGGPPAPEPIILSVSRLRDAYKGHDMVIQALPLVLARVPGARYVVVGDGPVRGYLERLARAHGVGHAVAFAGRAPDEELDDWYRRCRVFALLSRESARTGAAEGFGIVFVEAGLRGKPVVAGRSGGIPDAVLDGQTGLLVDPTDVPGIADALVRLLADDGLAARLGAEGRRRAVEDLAWPAYVRGFEAVLAEVVR